MESTVRRILEKKGNAIWSVPPDASVYDALALLADKDVGALLVMSNGGLAGIFSERDYARKVILTGRTSRELCVEDVMTAPVITVTPDHTIDECMRTVTLNRVRHLPVMDGGDLVGVVSIGDLVNAIISAQAEQIEALSLYIAGGYPA